MKAAGLRPQVELGHDVKSKTQTQKSKLVC